MSTTINLVDRSSRFGIGDEIKSNHAIGAYYNATTIWMVDLNN